MNIGAYLYQFAIPIVLLTFSKLLLLLWIRNAALGDGDLITYLSEATAGSLSGVGHSSAYGNSASHSWFSTSLQAYVLPLTSNVLTETLCGSF